MNYNTTTYNMSGFRPLYHHFCAFPLVEETREKVEDWPGYDEADTILTYGYIDPEVGLTLEIMALGKIEEESIHYFEAKEDVRAWYRVGELGDIPFIMEIDADGLLEKSYENKLAGLAQYTASPQIEQTRDLTYLDMSRDKRVIDIVRVLLVMEGNKDEFNWTRITGMGESYFTGILVEEPEQDFGYHEGDEIRFALKEGENGQMLCYAEVKAAKTLSMEDLADGTVLKQALSTFGAARNETNLLTLLQILKGCKLWVPFNRVLTKEDQERLMETVKRTGSGESFTPMDKLRMIPDLLQSNDVYYLSAFSSRPEMGKYGADLAVIPTDMAEVITLCRENPRKLGGIVINAFTDGFVLTEELFSFMEE